MKVSCLQENLVRGLSIVGRAIPARTTMPILTHVKMTAQGDQLLLESTDLALGLRCTVAARVDEPGAIAVPAKLLIDFVAALPPERVDLTLNVATQTLHLGCARSAANVKGLSAADYPVIPDGAGSAAFQVAPATLRALIDQVAFAAAVEEARPVLTGVLTTVGDGKLTMAAADGFRVAERCAALDSNGAAATAIIPARALHELARLLGDQTDPVAVVLTANRAVFQVGAVTLVTNLIEGKYPDYRKIIPTGGDIAVQMVAAELLKAVRVAALFARNASQAVCLSAAAGQMTVTAGSDIVGDNATALPATITGTDAVAVMAFNVKFLAQFLAATGDAEVVMQMMTAEHPAVFRLAGDENMIHVLMPMHNNTPTAA